MSSKTTKSAENWVDSLRDFPMDGLRPVFPELAGLEKDAAKKFGDTRRHVSRSNRAILKDARHLNNVIEDLGDLPTPGTAIHLLTAKRFSTFNIIEAILKLRAPATIEDLRISTLGFSRTNVEALAEMLDSHQVERLTFVFSIYFRSLEKASCENMMAELGRRGARIISLLQHSKVLTIQTSDGQNYVTEGSGNLRSCASLENVTIYNDPELLRFHNGWIDSLFEAKK